MFLRRPTITSTPLDPPPFAPRPFVLHDGYWAGDLNLIYDVRNSTAESAPKRCVIVRFKFCGAFHSHPRLNRRSLRSRWPGSEEYHWRLCPEYAVNEIHGSRLLRR
jgi:hypothetical protein